MPIRNGFWSSDQRARHWFDKLKNLASGEAEATTIEDQLMLDLQREWELLDEGRPHKLLHNEAVSDPLKVCSFALELGCYPPPWALKAVVETVDEYIKLARDLKSASGSDVPKQISQLVRLEEFLVDGVPLGNTAVGHLRSKDHDYSWFCTYTAFSNVFDQPEDLSLKACVERYLTQWGDPDQCEAFMRGLGMWANKSEENKAQLTHCRQMNLKKKPI